VAVSARDRSRDRGVDLSRFAWVDDTSDLARRDDVDVVVELIGGSDGPALTLARSTLSRRQGASSPPTRRCSRTMASNSPPPPKPAGTALKYEAAVAGGIPVIKGLREGAAANAIDHVYGMLNGTCNYILSTMEAAGRDFGEVLAEAQALGYAEADPSFDIDGVDAAHKLSILSSLAFGAEVDFGSRSRSPASATSSPPTSPRPRRSAIAIRLVGLGEAARRACSSASTPALCRSIIRWRMSPDRLNAVVAEGNYVGRLLFQGRGAGEGPTGERGRGRPDRYRTRRIWPRFRHAGGEPRDFARMRPAGERRGRAYLRFTVVDKPGVLAELTAAMRDAGVSIESLIQRGPAADGSVLIVIGHARGTGAVGRPCAGEARRIAQRDRPADADAHPRSLTTGPQGFVRSSTSRAKFNPAEAC
jgi:homoserine dehydrogenase